MAKQAQIDAVRPVLNALDAEVTAVEKVLDVVEANADKATDVLESGLEKAADVVPEVLDKSVHVTAGITRRSVRALRDPRKLVVVLGIAGVAVGAGVGYLTYKALRKKLEKQFEERLDAELDSMRDFYRQKYKAEAFATPQDAAEALGVNTKEESAEAKEAAEALVQYQRATSGSSQMVETAKEVAAKPPTSYDKVPPVEVIEEVVLKGVTISQSGLGSELKVEEKDIPVARNVFVEGQALGNVTDNWDAEAEEASRNPERPYIISHDEFMENNFEHEQTTLTYYEGDDVLAESDDSIIFEVEAVVGNDNLSRFGHGSRDSNIVYIRNERTESDYEVVRNTGNYADVVAPGLRHAENDFSRRRFRRGEDG